MIARLAMWGAILGGWIVATGIATLMYVAGLAFGFSAFDPYNASASAKGIGIGTAIWIVLTWVVSLFLGGMFASWFDGKADQTVGTLHGVAVWGLAVAASGLFVTLGITQVTGVPLFWFGIPRTETTSVSKARSVPMEL